MSRIGRKPVALPDKVKVAVENGFVKVDGPKGSLSMKSPPMIEVVVGDGVVEAKRPNDSREARALHGLARALINNMVTGVSQGFTRELEVHGVGYRAEVKGKTLNMALGFSHPVEFPIPEGITAAVDDKRTKITLSGIDKQLLGATAAKIRSFRPPEPYGGKGVRYSDEIVRRKEGKSGSK